MRKLAFVLSLLVIFTVPWENAVTIGEWGTMSRILGILTAAVWSFSLLSRLSLRRLRAFHFAIFCFVLWNAASLFWSLAVDQTIQHVKTYAQLALFMWILWDLCTGPKALAAALQAYILGAYVAIGATIYNYSAGIEISEYSGGRYAGADINAVDLVLVLAIGLPFAWHLATSSGTGIRNRVLRILNYVYIPAAIFGMTLTGSRTFLFTIFPFVVYLVWASSKNRLSSRVLYLFFLLTAGILAVPYIPESVIKRLSTTHHSVASLDLGGRGAIWIQTLQLFAEHPVLGVGSGVLHPPAGIGPVPHNTLLSVSAELGLPGFLIFACVLTIVLRQAAVQPKVLSQLWLAVLAIWFIGASVLTWEFRKCTWLVLGLVVISANLPDLRDREG